MIELFKRCSCELVSNLDRFMTFRANPLARRSRLRAVFILAAATGLLAACGPDVAKWKEEVLLHDGRMIVIERTAKAERGGFLSGTRGRDLEFEIKYKPLDLYWKGLRQQAALEVFDGVAYLVVTVGDEEEFCRGKPSATVPVQILQRQGDTWIPVKADTFPLDQANFNLYLKYWGNDAASDAKGLITWKYKEERDGYPIVSIQPTVMKQRPYKLREFFLATNGNCARYQPDQGDK